MKSPVYEFLYKISFQSKCFRWKLNIRMLWLGRQSICIPVSLHTKTKKYILPELMKTFLGFEIKSSKLFLYKTVLHHYDKIYMHPFIFILFRNTWIQSVSTGHKLEYSIYTHAVHNSQFSLANQNGQHFGNRKKLENTGGIFTALRKQNPKLRVVPGSLEPWDGNTLCCTTVESFYRLHSNQIIVLELSFTCLHIN